MDKQGKMKWWTDKAMKYGRDKEMKRGGDREVEWMDIREGNVGVIEKNVFEEVR